MNTCIYCGKELTGKQLKYCDNNGLCKYRYNSVKNEKITSCSHAQQLRMCKAGKKQRQGKIGCRYN
jgi:hypothetical protein